MRETTAAFLSSGYYKRHTVTVWGYEVWERQKQNIPENNSNDAGESSTENRARVGDFVINATGIERRVMLVINDHWSPEKRYIDLYSLDPAYGGPFFQFCRITPPEQL